MVGVVVFSKLVKNTVFYIINRAGFGSVDPYSAKQARIHFNEKDSKKRRTW